MMQIRRYDDQSDRAMVADLIDRVARHDGSEPLAEEKKAEWLTQAPGSVGILATSGERAVAYLHASPIPLLEAAVGWSIEMAFDPSHRSEKDLKAVLDRGIEECRKALLGEIHVWAFAPWLERMLESHQALRQLVIMGRALPADPPEPRSDVELRPFVVGQDEKAFLELNNRAFVDHPENGGWDLGILTERMSRPWFDPAGFLLAWESEHLAGFCWTKRHDPLLSEIYVIATDPDRRKRGLGHYLLLSGLDYMHRNGAERVMLYVRRGEEPAEALYRKVGFRRIERRTEFRYLPQLAN